MSTHYSDIREPKGQSKVHFSVKDLHRPDLKPNAGSDVDYSTDHITSGPAKRNLPIGHVAQKTTRS
jgi:hypothetical protein